MAGTRHIQSPLPQWRGKVHLHSPVPRQFHVCCLACSTASSGGLGTRLRCTYVVTLLPVLHWMWIKEQQKKTGEAWERVCIHGRVQLRVFYHFTSYAGPSPWLRGEVGWVSFAVVHNSWTHLILRSRCCKCVQFGERERERKGSIVWTKLSHQYNLVLF